MPPFPRNPDLWGHLASGRDWAHGRSPLAQTTWAPEWKVGQGWLYDVVGYLLYATAGGVGLVVAKALLIAALAVVLFRLSRLDDRLLIPLVCTGLALLAMGTRLLLQPATISCLFLGLAVWIVRTRSNREDRVSLIPSIALLVLFLIWSNMDSWFQVGLVVVALLWIGQILDSKGANRGRALVYRLSGVLIIAAVCLVNPAHRFAFAIPPELLATGPMPGGSLPVRSPWSSAYFDSVLQSPAGLAYFPLLVLGALSFVLGRASWRWERFLPWVSLAILSGCQVRTVPFFAVVAGPVLAWNLQNFFGRMRAAAEPSVPSRWARPRQFAAGMAAALLGCAFLACAWTGWLQAPPFEPRRWEIQTPAALQRTAEEMGEWKRQGILPPGSVVLHHSPDSAAEFAWFCPDVNSVREPALNAQSAGDWDLRLRSAGISHLVMFDSNRSRLFPILANLFANPERFALLRLDGRVTVFGRREPRSPAGDNPFEEDIRKLNRLALWPAPAAKVPPALPPVKRHWWDPFLKPAPEQSSDRDEASVRLLQAESFRLRAPARHLLAWEATQLAGMVGAADSWMGPTALLDADARLLYFRPPLIARGVSSHPLGNAALACHPAFVRGRDDCPIAVLYLAVRAARRAVARDPLDAQAYGSLGDAYFKLIFNSRERASIHSFTKWQQLRRAQAVAALRRAVTLDPNLELANFQLGTLFLDMGCLDNSLEHYRAYLKAGARRKRPMRGNRSRIAKRSISPPRRSIGSTNWSQRGPMTSSASRAACPCWIERSWPTRRGLRPGPWEFCSTRTSRPSGQAGWGWS